MNVERMDSLRQMRKQIINSAIYVEKPLIISRSTENTSICQKLSQEDMSELKLLRTKRCTCSVDPQNCLCHPTHAVLPIIKNCDDVNKKSIVPRIKEPLLKTKISSTSIISYSSTDSCRDAAMKQWLVKKEAEKKERILKEKLLKEAIEKQRQMVLEQERRNFQVWLIKKKEAEIEIKKKKEREDEEQKQLKDLEHEKKQLQNQISYKLWMRKKNELQLERKIEEQTKLIRELENKQKQLVDNQRAFNEWLENSKNKPKPIPLNRGLESLCSRSSLTYINPTPWNPSTP